MTNPDYIEEKNKEFFERFGADKIWVNPSKDNAETILEIWGFMNTALQEQKIRLEKEWVEKIEQRKKELFTKRRG